MTVIKIKFSIDTEIEEAFTEAIRLAKFLQVNIEFKFNNIYTPVTCMADWNGIVAIGVARYYAAAELKDPPIVWA